MAFVSRSGQQRLTNDFSLFGSKKFLHRAGAKTLSRPHILSLTCRTIHIPSHTCSSPTPFHTRRCAIVGSSVSLLGPLHFPLIVSCTAGFDVREAGHPKTHCSFSPPPQNRHGIISA